MASIDIIPDLKIKKDILANTSRISGEIDTNRVDSESADIVNIVAETITATTINTTNTPEEFTEIVVDTNPTLISAPGNYILIDGGETIVNISFTPTSGDIIKVVTEDNSVTFSVDIGSHYNSNTDPPSSSSSEIILKRGGVIYFQYDGTRWYSLNNNSFST